MDYVGSSIISNTNVQILSMLEITVASCLLMLWIMLVLWLYTLMYVLDVALDRCVFYILDNASSYVTNTDVECVRFFCGHMI